MFNIRKQLIFIFSTSASGVHNLTSLSIPLVANKNSVGCGCKQLTIELSAFNTIKLFSVCLSHTKNKPSSEPATIN